MTSPAVHECSECTFPLSEGDPFCPKCGHIVPNLLSPGSLALQLNDVAAAQARADLVRTLKVWFPDLDVLRAEKRLKYGSAILVSGIDEPTGSRLLEAFKKMRVQGGLLPQPTHSSWLGRIWNPGLVAGGLLLVIGASLGGIPGFLLSLFGLATPFGWGFWREAQLEPLVPAPRTDPAMDRLLELSEPLSHVIERLSDQDARALTSLAKIIFAVQRGLRSKSLASVAAGEERGDLSSLLIDSLATAVDLSGKIASEDGEARERARVELKNLTELTKSTYEWFKKLDKEDVKPVPEIEQQIDQIMESIDRIVQDVRPPLAAARPRIERNRLGQ